MKNKFYLVSLCSLLALSSTSVFAQTSPEVPSSNTFISESKATSEQTYTPTIDMPESRDSQSPISNQTVSGKNTYSTYWTQNQAYGYYKVNYVNNTSVSATIYVKSTNGDSHSYNIPANSEKALYVSNAHSGQHTIDIESGSGSINLSGKLSVKTSDNPIS